jgi:predicted kinase
MAKENCLYILCGLPFAGKTTLARTLVNQQTISHVAIDTINSERGAWDDETGMSPEEWAVTYSEAYSRIDALLSQGKSVVDDSVNFTRELRDRLRAIAERYSTQTMVIYVDIPIAEIRRRWQENRRTAARADVRESDFLQVAELFEPPTEGENVLCYDGSMPIETWVRLTFS